MANSAGEMPFLDHLEELRKRILLALCGVVVGLGIGWGVVRHFHVIQVIQRPIMPYLPTGKLMVTTMVGPFMLNFKLAVVVGLVLSSPWVIYQLWIFLAPALTTREKKAILPALGIGLLLFLAGALIGWIWVLPPTVKWFIQFDAGSFNVQVTYDSYISLVINLLLAMGISAELPLIMTLLASLGIVTYRMYKKLRRYAFFLSFVGGAILSPTPEIVMMLLFTLPLLLLYEIGVVGAWIVDRRRARAARLAASVAGMLLLSLVPRHLHAQVPVTPPRPVGDTSKPAVTGQGVRTVIDSATCKRLGIPCSPTRAMPAPDSIMQSLLDRPDFAITRFISDSASFDVVDQRILMRGHVATERDGNHLEADQIMYDDLRCEGEASGLPQLFQPGQAPSIGIVMRFNTCKGVERGVIDEAYTSMPERGSNWFIRGNLAVDSSGKRLFAAKGEFTSCDLPDPHYHFSTGEMKWVSQSVIVARPAVLYIRDVPIAWLPFIFQDTKSGRASGILIPRFGFNDIVRPVRTYNRQITNIGYYWAPNAYVDATAHLDWYANRNTTYGVDFNYNWLDRFVRGGIHASEQVETGGGTDKTLSWQHDQSFNVTTSLSLNVNYSSNTQVLANNALTTAVVTQQIYSQANFKKRFSWGQLSLGGSRRQTIENGETQVSLPQLTISPKQLSIAPHITWSPNLTVSNDLSSGLPDQVSRLTPTGTFIDTSSNGHTRSTAVTLSTPLVIYGFNWNNTLNYLDQQIIGHQSVSQRIHDPSSSNPADSITVTTVTGGRYQTGFDWDFGVSLPVLLQQSWKLTPSVGVTNTTSGPLVVRSSASDGSWVWQGKKMQLGLSSAPTFFGFLNHGLGPYSRFRYTLSPLMSLTYSPAASISSTYAQAIGNAGGSLLSIPATTLATVTLHQSFDAKLRPPASDTNTDPIHLQSLPKKQILSISTSPISYDIQQAQLPHHTGWTPQDQTLTNTFSTDLLQGFSLSLTHDLWEGMAGSDTAKFSPFLSDVHAGVSITGRTFRSIAGLLGLVHHDSASTTGPALGTSSPLAAAAALSTLGPGASYQRPLPRTGFSMTMTYDLQRFRPFGMTAEPVSTEPSLPGSIIPIGINTFLPVAPAPPQSSVGLTMSFSPTPFWSVSWNTLYDFTHGGFQSQQIQLQRDLHDWRASFNFNKSANGNFALYFTVYLISLPEIKFDYNQTTLQQTPLTP